MKKTFAICVLFPIGLVLIMLIIPLPTLVLDILIAVNILFALIIIIVVLNSKKITDFTLLPTLLLELKVFSMTVSISITRLILTRGTEFDGRLIRFVSFLFTGSGNTIHLIIGLTILIFIIAISIIMNIKTTIRVAEVATQFNLDAIQEKSDFFGTLDGFIKFPSNKINLFIIAIIIVGGTLIDTLYKDIPVKTAIITYIPLAVGSGFFIMFPSFLLSIATGCIVAKWRKK